MASIVGHILGARLVYKALKGIDADNEPEGFKEMAIVAGLAITPDIDVLINMALSPYGTHRGISHSVVTAVVLAFIAAYICRKSSRRLLLAWVIFFFVCLVHPALDYLMACGPPVPFWTPFYKKGYLAPVQLIPTAYYSQNPAGLIRILFLPQTWLGVFLETLLFFPLIRFIADKSSAITTRSTYLILSSISLTLIYFIYN